MDDASRFSLVLLCDRSKISAAQLDDEIRELLHDCINDIEFSVQLDNGALLLRLAGPMTIIDACYERLNNKVLNRTPPIAVRYVDEAGDEARRRLYPILSRIEQQVRAFIVRTLSRS